MFDHVNTRECQSEKFKHMKYHLFLCSELFELYAKGKSRLIPPSVVASPWTNSSGNMPGIGVVPPDTILPLIEPPLPV